MLIKVGLVEKSVASIHEHALQPPKIEEFTALVDEVCACPALRLRLQLHERCPSFPVCPAAAQEPATECNVAQQDNEDTPWHTLYGRWGRRDALEGERASEAAQEAVRQAVGGGCQSGWGRLLSATNATDAGICRQGDSGWA